VIDLEPNETQRAVQAQARSFAQEVLAPRAAQLDREGGFPHDSLARAAQAGLLGINIPKALGGRGAGGVA